jgi:hypothetical protein
MALSQYRIPISRLQNEFARRMAWQIIRGNQSTASKSEIADNSAPWASNPRTVDDLWEISCQTQHLIDQRKPDDGR